MPHDLSAERRPSEPWLSFLTELDAALDGPADFHCIGGFVVSQHYGFARETADLDVLTVIPPEVPSASPPWRAKVRHSRGSTGSTSTTSASPTTRMTTRPALSASFPSGRKSACRRSNRTISRSRSWNGATTATSAT